MGIDVSGEAHLVQVAMQQAAWSIEASWTAPHAVMRPRVFPDGSAWCALYGDNIQDGVAGFGETPAAACADFDKNWREQQAGPGLSK